MNKVNKIFRCLKGVIVEECPRFLRVRVNLVGFNGVLLIFFVKVTERFKCLFIFNLMEGNALLMMLVIHFIVKDPLNRNIHLIIILYLVLLNLSFLFFYFTKN